MSPTSGMSEAMKEANLLSSLWRLYSSFSSAEVYSSSRPSDPAAHLPIHHSSPRLTPQAASGSVRSGRRQGLHSGVRL